MATPSGSNAQDTFFDNVQRAADANLQMQRAVLNGWTRLWPAFSHSQSGWFDAFFQLQQRWTDTVWGLAGKPWDVLDRQLDTAIQSLEARLGTRPKRKESSRPPQADFQNLRDHPPAAALSQAPERRPAGAKNIADKVAIVTGAASGIGEAVARELAHRGARSVLLVDRSDAVRDVADAINQSLDRKAAEAMVGDTRDGDFRMRVYDEASARHGVVTICVPAAGITRDALSVRVDKETGRATVYPIEDFRKVTEINLIAPIYWAMEMVARIAEDRHRRGLKRWKPEETVAGAVVFLGSVSSQGNKGQISYAVAKAGLEGAAATLMKEAMFHGVRCGIIHPGFTDTPMARALGKEFLEKNVLPFTQLRRLIRPEEIADAICFMISNSAVSGELWADAGWHPPA